MPLPSPTLYPSPDLFPSRFSVHPSILVREKPPLFEMVDVATPTGRHYRWASDEVSPDRVPADVVYQDVMPGGDDSFEGKLPRKPNIDYADIVPMSTLRVLDAGGEVLSTTRLEKAPRVSGDDLAVTPQAVGHKVELDDNKLAAEIYVDQDKTAWASMPATLRAASIASWLVSAPQVESDKTTYPVLNMGVPDSSGTIMPWTFGLYDAGAARIGDVKVAVDWSDNIGDPLGSWWEFLLQLADDDNYAAGYDDSGNLITGDPMIGEVVATTDTRRFAYMSALYNFAIDGWDGKNWDIYVTMVAVRGRQGLPLRGEANTVQPAGVFASDVIAHAVRKYCPSLAFTYGLDGTIRLSDFIHRQLAFKEPTTPGEIVKEANRVHLWDWFVRDKVFHYEPRGTSARRWIARASESELTETGPDVARIWNGIGARYTDVDGTTRSVGPPGSGAMVESERLRDRDPDNPFNQLDIPKFQLLEMSRTSTAEVAIEVCTRFMEESKYIDRSGSATLIGHVKDDRGIWHPYSHVQAGDEISFVDAADTSFRRIVKARKSRTARSCDIDLDAPPAGMDALLERLGAAIAPLGLS